MMPIPVPTALRLPVAVLAAVLLVAGCADPDGIDPDGVDPASSRAPTSSVTSSVGDPPSSAVGAPGDLDPWAPTTLRQLDLDGAIVTTRSALDELPEQASVVRFSSTLIDTGSGLELCLGGVAESLPPQCSGPVVVDLDPQGWTETMGGVTWGDRTVVVAWPPVDGELVLIEDGPPRPPSGESSEADLDPGGSHDEATLMGIQDQLSAAGLYGPTGPVLSSGIGVTPGRLDVTIVVADLTTIREVLEVVDVPDAVHLFGLGEVLAG